MRISDWSSDVCSSDLELTYSAPGDPALAKKLVQRIVDESMDARVDGQRGFDHGMFIPLKLMFPGADVPVIQLSLRRDLDPGAHLELGRVLAALRDGVGSASCRERGWQYV